jgi:hypothetical protein
MITQCSAYASSISNAQTMKPVGGFQRRFNPSQVLSSSSPLEINTFKIERRNTVCQATSAPGVSITPDLALN